MTLSPQDLDRHARHIMLKEIGGPGVQKLRAANVSIIGAGALGGPCALYLAAAGLGRIEIWDDDLIERSNLQRQVQFSDADVGAGKAQTLSQRIIALDPGIEVTTRPQRFEPGCAPQGDVLIDASDNYPTRFLLNETAHRTGRRLVSGAAARWQGQVSLFESGLAPGQPCYRCFVPEAPPEAEACETVGVLGAVTGMVGVRMALETVKLITGAGDTLGGKVWILDGLAGVSRVVQLRQDTECQVCGN